MKILFATGNAHKVEELEYILKDTSVKIVPPYEFGLTGDIEETGDTLEENAIIKARYYYDTLKVSAIGEDTGLEVSALNNAPGVKTARYAGDQRDSLDNMKLLLSNLENKEDRTARFRTVVAFIHDERVHLFEGIVNGRIGKELRGDGGFGYDPIFIPDGYEISFAQMDDEVKNKISHRSRAVNKWIAYLEENNLLG